MKFPGVPNLYECAFALIDPVIAESLPNGLGTRVLVPKRLLPSKHLMPVLLDFRTLSSDSSENLRIWMECGANYSQEPLISFLVTSDTSADEFSRHWNEMQLPQTSSTRKFWLRLHDPRVMHQLLHILTPAQRRRLFGRAKIFHYRLEGKWIEARRDEDHAADLYGSTRNSLSWDWDRIGRIGIVNRALLGSGVGGALESRRLAILVEQLIDRAIMRHHLEDDADLVEFAVRGLRTTPTFDNHPEIALALKMRAEPPERNSLADRFALIEPHIWDSLSLSTNSSTR